jgi:hypothetical protein
MGKVWGTGSGCCHRGCVAPPDTLHRTLTPALQEKVAEVETRLREQLLDTERRLNEARREQAKAGKMDQSGHEPSRKKAALRHKVIISSHPCLPQVVLQLFSFFFFFFLFTGGFGGRVSCMLN